MTTGLTRDQVAARLDALEAQLRHSFFEGRSQHRAHRGAAGSAAARRAARPARRGGRWRARAARPDRRDSGGAGSGAHARARRLPGAAAARVRRLCGRLGGASCHDSIAGQPGRRQPLQPRSSLCARSSTARRRTPGACARPGGGDDPRRLAGAGHVANYSGARRHEGDLPRPAWPAPRTRSPLPPDGQRFAATFAHFQTALHNAANFAFGNRFFLALMMRRALEQSVGPTDMQVLYDAPHNLMWEQPGDDGTIYLHRKGADMPTMNKMALGNNAYEHWGRRRHRRPVPSFFLRPSSSSSARATTTSTPALQAW